MSKEWAEAWAQREAEILAGVVPAVDWPTDVRPDATIGAYASLEELRAAWDVVRSQYIEHERESESKVSSG